MISLEKWIILTPLQKFPQNGEDWDKLIVAKGFKRLPKVQNITQSGHTDSSLNVWLEISFLIWCWRIKSSAILRALSRALSKRAWRVATITTLPMLALMQSDKDHAATTLITFVLHQSDMNYFAIYKVNLFRVGKVYLDRLDAYLMQSFYIC